MDGHPKAAAPWRRIIGAAVVLLAVASVGAVFATRGGEQDLGTVDGVTLQAFEGDGAVRLASFGGRPLVVNYWASWCTFCIEEMPAFQEVYADVRDDVEFLGIDLQDSPDVARRLANATGVRYPLAADRDGSSFERLDAVGMPTTLFVDERGKIVERHTGPLDAAGLRDRISRHFGV